MKDTLTKTCPEFKELLKRIQIEKTKNGTADITDRRTFSQRRITLAMIRHKEMEDIVRDIVNSKLDLS